MAGCERRFLELSKRLAKRNHEVHVYTVRYDKRLPKEEVINGVFIHRCAYSNRYLSTWNSRSLDGVLKYSLSTLVQLSEQNFDVYYSNQWPMIHSFFAKPFASPLIQEWCEVWYKPLKMMLLQHLLKKFGDYHVAVSEFTKQRLLNFLGLDKNKVATIPNGVDNSKFHCNPNKKIWGRIIYVGRLVPHKHVGLLVDAFRIVKEKIPEAELHIVGSGPSMQIIKNRASRIKGCFIYGFLPDDQMVKLLESAWLFVSASEREGSGIAFLEAMAAGIPFITVNYPDNAAKKITRFKCGLAVNPSSESISSAIIRLLKSEELWKMMSRKALDLAKSHDWNIIADHMDKFLRSVANKWL